MTNQEAKEVITAYYNKIKDSLENEYTCIVPFNFVKEGDLEAFKMAIKALENIGHLTDRPCSVCEFHKENGCCKWDCVFEGV